MMGNNDFDQTEGACNLENIHINNCDTSANPDSASFCQFLKCIPKEKPIYLEMPGHGSGDDNHNMNVHNSDLRNFAYSVPQEGSSKSSQHPNDPLQINAVVKEMIAEQEEDGTWVVRWKTDRQQCDFIGLSSLGKPESFYLDFTSVYLF